MRSGDFKKQEFDERELLGEEKDDWNPNPRRSHRRFDGIQEKIDDVRSEMWALAQTGSVEGYLEAYKRLLMFRILAQISPLAEAQLARVLKHMSLMAKASGLGSNHEEEEFLRNIRDRSAKEQPNSPIQEISEDDPDYERDSPGD